MRGRAIVILVIASLIGAAFGQVIGHDAKLAPEDRDSLDRFGESVALAGGLVAAGASGDDDNGNRSGSAYLFDVLSGEQVSKVKPKDGAANDEFGFPVAMGDALLVVGAVGDNERGDFSGAAYIFRPDTGEQVAKLLASDGGAGDRFGGAIAVRDGVVAVGALLDDDRSEDAGAVYLFDAMTGEQLAKLTAPDAAGGDQFGAAVAMGGGVLAVGAPRADEAGSNSGGVYLFDVGSRDFLGALRPVDGAPGAWFGATLALEGEVVLAGAPRDPEFGERAGAAYLFDVSTRGQIAKLTPDDASAGARFGRSVALDAGVALVGAWREAQNGDGAGAAYAFDVETREQLAKLIADDGRPGDFLGFGVAIEGDTAVVGAWGDDDGAEDKGSAYVFTLPGDNGDDCPTDWDGNGVVNPADVGAYLSDYFRDLANGTLVADFDGNGVTNPADVGAFLSAYFPALGPCS